MAIIAEFTAASNAFPLGNVFENVPDASVELDRIVPTRNAVVPYAWVRDAPVAVVERAGREDPELGSVRFVDQAGDTSLYRLEWRPDASGIPSCLVETDVSLLSGSGTRDEWVFEVRADSHADVSRFQQCCESLGIGLTVSRLHALAEATTRTRYNLTPEQREALLLAFEKGYFAEPRRASLQDLAADLGIARPSLSGRLKRGYRNLIASTLVHGAGSAE